MKKVRIKRLIPLLLMLTCTLLFAGCASVKLADAFDEDTVKSAAEEVVRAMNEGDYEGVTDKLRSDLKDKLSAGQLREVMDTNFSERGEFKKIKSLAVVGQKTADTKEDSAVAVAVAEYENQKATYTISFDTNMEIIGFYIK